MGPINPIKSVAVIGAGPSGAIAVDALMQEKVFDVVRVFERQEKAGGCWYNSLPLALCEGVVLTGAGYREMRSRHESSILIDWLRVQLMRH